ncbi:MAG TPA: glycoside hydrolase family 88 protein [Pyrinomonadaceae bacterium]|nr:glycoside hydrolase family 88 protein [Pyrinomonadaceae bacterium]
MLKKIFVSLLTVAAFSVLSGTRADAQSKYFGNWAPGTSPKEVGKRLAENWMKRDFEFEGGKRQYVIYPEICTWYGALTVAEETKDKDLQTRLTKKFDRFLTAEGAKNISQQAHVDYRVFGVVPLELFMQTKDNKYLTLGQSFADKQWEKTTADGITAEARYWIDDMYMITAVQTQAYRATKDKKYLDRAALAAAAYLDKLQQPNGLFYHAPDSPYYWGRGNGWFAAGMAELLSDLPKNHPKRERILRGYREMMASLLKYQTADGLWRQLIDVPESWEETSGAAMFAFGMVTGVKKGWLDAKTYGPAARKAWLGLVKHLDENGYLKDVCVGTNKGYSVKYYIDRERETGNLHGQAPMLWTATALLK